MRASSAAALLLVVIGLAGCTSAGSVDALQDVSPETTSSVPRPAALVAKAEPQAKLASASFSDQPQATLVSASPDDAPQPVLDYNATPTARPAEVLAMITPEKAIARTKAVLRQQIFRTRFRDAKPINFGRFSPKRLSVHGVDVSRWQGEIDWAKLRAQGANFAYIKATDGGDHVDPMFTTNWKKADAAGLKRGAYHFFYWCRTAGEQADWFIRNVPRDDDALPPVIDVEWNHDSSCRRHPSRARILEKMQVFMDALERHYGRRPIIYTSPDFYRDNLAGAFPDYPFWLRSVAAHPKKLYRDRKWLFWQYSGSGLSHGVEGRVDLNVFHGSEDDWHDFITGRQVLASE